MRLLLRVPHGDGFVSVFLVKQECGVSGSRYGQRHVVCA
jgi:hypothetical protein